MVKTINLTLKLSGETIIDDLVEEWIKDCLYKYGIECIDINKEDMDKPIKSGF